MPNVIEIVVAGKDTGAKALLADTKKDSEGLAGAMGKMQVAAGAALAGVGYESVKMATAYESSTTRLVTSAGETTQNLDMVRKGMLDMAGQVGISADDLAKGMYTVESAGYHGAAGLTVLKAAAQGAKDENADLGTVANAVTDVLVDYHMKASDAADVTSKMVTAVSYGKTTFQDFSGAMHNILPLASAMHLSFADVSGVLAEMTAHGMSADQASQDIQNTMRTLIAPTSKMSAEMQLLGISAQDVRDKLSTQGLSGAMQFLADTAKKVGPNVLDQEAAMKKLMGTAPGLVTALMTTGENASATSAAIQGIGAASTDAQGQVKGFSEVQQTLGQKVAEVKANFTSLLIEIGQKLIPILKDATDWLLKHKSAMEGILAAVLALSAALVAYSVTMKVVALATGLWTAATWLLNAALDANPIVLIIAALVALGVAIYEIWTHWKTVWGAVKDIAGDVGAFVSKVWRAVADDAKKIWGDITDALGKIWDGIADLWNSTGGIVVSTIARAWDEISSAIAVEWDHILSDLSSIWSNLTQLWNDTGGKLVGYARDAWNAIWDIVIRPVWELVTGYLTAGLQILQGTFIAGWDVIQGVFHASWDVIKGVVVVTWDYISTIIKVGLDVISGVMAAGWDVIKGAVKVAWGFIKAAINTPLDAIKDLLQLFTDFVTGHWSKLWGDVKKAASDAWNNIGGFIGSTLATIKKTVVDGATAIWNGFTSAIGAALSGIGKALASIQKTIADFFKDAGKWLYNAGASVVQGLIDGIGSMASKAASTAGNIASSVASNLNPMNWFAHGGEVSTAATGGDRSGLVMVGEQGPEMVRLPTGSTVRSNPDTMSALADGGQRGGAGPTSLEIVVSPGSDSAVATMIMKLVRTGQLQLVPR